MKKRNLLFAAIFAMVMCTGLSLKAQDSVFSYAYQGTTLYYIIDSNQQARVVPPLYPAVHWNADSTESQTWYGYTKPQGAVVVPDSVVFNGGLYPVTGLLKYAFYHCDSVTSVTLPASVTYLGNDAFTSCSLETVSMPGVTFMGEGCFYYAGSLTSVDIPAGVAFIPEWGFDHCESLQSVTLHNGTTAIGRSAFQWCPNLSSVTLPESLNTLGTYCFNACTALQSVALPNNLTSIGSGAFFNCSNLQSVTFPNSLTNLGNYAFYGCSSLQSVNIPGSVSVIRELEFCYCTSLTTVTLNEGTDTIALRSFYYCPNLTTINYPSTLKAIGDYAFQFDNQLASPVILPEGLTNLGILAYGNCSRIVSAHLPGSLSELSPRVFYNCTSLSKVTVENGVYYIGERAFDNCTSLDTIVLKCTYPPDLGDISDSAFTSFDATVVVPCGLVDLYHNYAIWNQFTDIIEDCGVGITENNLPDVTIRVSNSRIVVEGADGEKISVFDITGRNVRNEALSAGVYLVQIGNRPAQKVVVHPKM